MGLFKKNSQEKKLQEIKDELSSSRRSFKDKLVLFFNKHRHVDEDLFSCLTDELIESDVGATLATALVDELKDETKIKGIKEVDEIYKLLINKLEEFYLQDEELSSDINYAKEGPTVLLIVGVNGVGKTTAIAKLAYKLKNENKKVLLVAGDTFRAGATEQLSVWANRIGVDIVEGKLNSDPSSVIFDGLKKGKEENYDVIICDTAGRLQTKQNLMNELDKIHRVMQKLISDAPHEAFLVLDATMGQNGIKQASSFAEVTDLSGIILTKMDSTSKGGIVLAIRHQLGLPVRYIGIGEKMEDLCVFDLKNYLWGLVGGENNA